MVYHISLVEGPLGVAQATRAPQVSDLSVHCGVEGGTSAVAEWWDEIVQVEDLSVGCSG